MQILIPPEDQNRAMWFCTFNPQGRNWLGERTWCEGKSPTHKILVPSSWEVCGVMRLTSSLWRWCSYSVAEFEGWSLLALRPVLNVVNKDTSQFSLLQLTHEAKHAHTHTHAHSRTRRKSCRSREKARPCPCCGLPEVCVNEHGNAVRGLFFFSSWT